MMKDKKTIIGILLIVAIMVGWGIWMRPSKEEREKAAQNKQHVIDSTNKANIDKRISDSLELVKANAPDSTLFKDSAIVNLPDSIKQTVIDSIQLAQKKDSLGIFAAHGVGSGELITVETEKFLLTFSPKGGIIQRCQMLGFQSYKSRYVEKKNDTLDLWVPNQSGYFVTVLTDNSRIETSDLYFETDAKKTKIKGDEKATLRFKVFANNDKAKYLEYVYTISGNDNMIDFDINLVGMNKIIEQNLGELPFTWGMTTPSQEREVSKERESSNIYYSNMEGDVSQLKGGTKGKPKKGEVKFPLKWVSFKQQFFSTAIVPSTGFTSNLHTLGVVPGTTDKENKMMAAELAIPLSYTPNETFKMRMYMGPNHWNTMKKYDVGLQNKQIDLGYVGFINRWLVIPVFNFFDGLNWNYGLIILVLTLIIKIITMPLIYKTFVSSAKMRLLKPDIDALNEKFKPEEAMAKQQAVMALYKRAGVSPLAGCIPALLQMPILFAMIAFFPAAFELRQQGLFWAEDLSTYDSILKLPFSIPAYGDHVSLFALLMTVTTIFYTKMNSGQMAAQGGIQAQQMKIMMYLMPVVFLVFLNSYSAALSYYYFLSNLISILLMLFIRKFMIDEKKLHAKIEENKKKTPKKSKWMSRMEDIQKTRTEQMRQQQNKGKKK